MIDEIPFDFPHQTPEGYKYKAIRKDSSTIAIWTIHNPGFVYNGGDDIYCIWGFYKPKKGEYYAPINSKKVGRKVDVNSTTPYTAMQLNLNPLEAVLYS